MIRPQPNPSSTTRPSRPPTHSLSLHTEINFIRDSLKGLLHTIFFQRLFPAVRPLTRDITFNPPTFSGSTRIQATPSHLQHSAYASDPPTITFPLVDDADVETAISEKATQLSKSLERLLKSDPNRQVKKTVKVHFYEKKRKKAATGFAGFWKESGAGSDVNGVCWESWEMNVVAEQSRAAGHGRDDEESDDDEEDEADVLVRKSVRSLGKAMMDVLRVAGEQKEHIPPITSAESNPFPYEIVIEPGK